MGLLDDIDAQTFQSSIYTNADMKSYDAAKDVLAMMGLPNPRKGAYYSRENSDRFYLPEGLVVTALYRHSDLLRTAAYRLGLTKEAPAPVFGSAFVERDDILQPLLTIPLTDRCIIEINAGVAAIHEDGQKHLRRLQESFEAQGLRVLNNHPETLGVLPDPDRDDPLVLVRNRRAVAVQDMGKAQGEAVRQSRILGELQGEFADAAQSGSHAQFRKVFDNCARIVALSQGDRNRILDPYWMAATPDDTLRQQEIVIAAQRYARQLNVA